MKKFTYLINILFVVWLLTCCERLFVPDPIDSRLPKYTENGNDVAGALINNEIWKSVVKFHYEDDHYARYDEDGPLIILYDSIDTLRILFKGESKICNIIEFRLSGLNINKFEDLILLNNKKIQLDGVKNYALFIKDKQHIGDSYYNKTPGIGQLYIKSVSIKNSPDYATFSGTFGFIVNDSVYGKVEVSYGRFDFDLSRFLNFEELQKPVRL